MVQHILPIWIHIPAFLAIYFVMDALHDTWFKKETEWREKAAATDDEKYRKVCQEKATRYSRFWHTLDACIKAWAVGNLVYVYVGVDWLVLWWGAFAGFFRWILHDLSWNAFNKMKWSYRGVISQLDTLKISDTLYFLIKFAGLAGSVIILIIHYSR